MKARTASRRSAGWWTDRSISTKGLVVVAVPVAILLAVLGSVAWFTHVNDRAQTIGGQDRTALTLTTQIENNVLAADNAVRGYLLSGDSSQLLNFTRVQAWVPPALVRLAAVVGSAPARTAAYEQLRSASNRTMSDLAAVASAQSARASQVEGFVPTSQADSTRLRQAVANLAQQLNADLATEHGAVGSSFFSVLVITVVAAVLAIAVGILVSQLFTSGVARRLRRLERATVLFERGGEPVEVPGGNDEIGRLAQRFLTSAKELNERQEERDRTRSQLEDILTASPVVSLRYDVAQRAFSYASPNVERLLGMTAEEVIADPAKVIGRFHPDDERRLREALVESLRRAQIYMQSAGSRAQATEAGSARIEPPHERIEITLRFHPDPSSNKWGEVEAIYTLEYDREGALAGVVSYWVDASERHIAQRAADERRSMLETIFHASPDTIVVRDVAGCIILASSTMADVIGVGQRSVDRTGEIVEEESLLPSVQAEDRNQLEVLTTRCLAGEPTPDPVLTTSRFPDGKVRTFETRARAVLDGLGHVIGTVTVSRDITDRTELEQSLRMASDEAERASDAKSEFLSRMSHELRTPLNAILGFTQLLELDELSGDQASSVDQIQRAGRHLLSLINEVLDISRIEAGRLSLTAEPVLVGEVLDEVTMLLMPVAENAEIELSVDSSEARDLFVRADRQRLVQILLNLGSNALKYNERRGSVSFRTWAPRAGRVRFEVHDTGPGIPVEKQDELFMPFSRLGAEHSGVEGTGVGLVLSKQLVELMGGSIGVDSTPGRGSTFWVELLAALATTTRTLPEDRPLEEGGQLEGSGRIDFGTQLIRINEDSEFVGNAVGVANGGTANGHGSASVVPLGSVQSGGLELSDAKTGNPVSEEVVGRVELHEGGGPGVEVVVLQIEDNESNASLVEQVLARRPAVHLVSSADASVGLELAREYRPDLILLDLHLPDMPGEEVLHRLKADPELSGTKVVVVSADATPSRIRRMLELGVEGYLTKPVDVEALLRLVDVRVAASVHPPTKKGSE